MVKVDEFEKQLNSIKIPNADNQAFKKELREKLKNTFFKPTYIYKRKIKLVAGFACILLIFIFILLLKPQIALSIHGLAFKQEEKTKYKPRRKLSPEYDISKKSNYAKDFWQYTTIHNPTLTAKINASQYKEEKAFLIRKYSSKNDGKILIVSEFDRNNNYIKPKITY